MRFSVSISPFLPFLHDFYVAAAVDGTTVLQREAIEGGGRSYSIAVASYAVEAPSDSESSSSDSHPTTTPPTSVHDSPDTSISTSYRASHKMEVSTNKKLASFSSPAKALDAEAISPALMIDFLTSRACNFSAGEMTAAYRTILRASILAFDAETGLSHFSWAYDRLSALDDRAKQVALLHTNVTIASLCKAFLSYLEEEEKTEDFANFVAGSSTPVNLEAIESALLEHRELAVAKGAKGAKGVPPAASKKASKSDVEKFKQQIAERDAQIASRKKELDEKRAEVKQFHEKLHAKNILIDKKEKEINNLQIKKLEAEALAASSAAKFSAADTEAIELKAKWTAALEAVNILQTEAKSANEKFDHMCKLVVSIGEQNDLLFEVTCLGDDRVGQQILGVQQMLVEQAQKIVELESKLKETQEELDGERAGIRVLRECAAGVSRRVPLCKSRTNMYFAG